MNSRNRRARKQIVEMKHSDGGVSYFEEGNEAMAMDIKEMIDYTAAVLARDMQHAWELDAIGERKSDE